MGDMADWTIENGMIADDFYDYDDYVDYGKPVKCRDCGKEGLYWSLNRNENWWLTEGEGGPWHKCGNEPPSLRGKK